MSVLSRPFRLACAALAVAAALACAFPACAFPACADDAPRMAVKRLFAPASDVERGMLRLPDPAATPTRSRVTVLTGAFASMANGVQVARFGFAHGGGPLRLVPLGVDACRWRGRLVAGKSTIALAGADDLVGRVAERFTSQSFLEIEDPTRSYEVDVPEGQCAVEFVGGVANGTPAALIVEDASDAAIVVHLASRLQRAGGELEFVVRGEAPAAGIGLVGGLARPLADVRARVTWAGGKSEDASIVAAAPDGSVRVVFAHAPAGDAIVQIDGAVLDAQGVARARTVCYLTHVADGPALAGRAGVRASELAGMESWAECAIDLDAVADAGSVFACAELWASSDRGERLIGWTGGLAEVEQSGASRVARIGFDRANAALDAGERLVLRNVRLHERDGFALLDLREEIVPEVEAGLLESEAAAASGDAASREVAWAGVPGVATVAVPAIQQFVPPVGGHALVLSHGYCAGSNPWPSAQFASDAWKYENLSTNLSNDAFAVDIATRAAQFKSYGIVAHSQGGCAALHLYAFYWSGLDWAGAGRLMQCVGSPLEGTALAGNIAALGQVLGIQCGANYDMTYDGAAAWLSTIPSSARAKLYTHTTTFNDVPFFYDYCSIASDAFLSDPEDGVVEHSAGHIVGANDMGLRSGWCHVGGMRDPAQTGDSSRNATMNTQGAR